MVAESLDLVSQKNGQINVERAVEKTVEEKIRKYFDNESYIYMTTEEAEEKLENYDQFNTLKNMIMTRTYCDSRKNLLKYNNLKAPVHLITSAPLRLAKEVLLIRLYNEIENSNAEVIVDGGCGTGLDLCFLAHDFPVKKFYGYDMSQGMLAEAEKRVEKHDLENVGLLLTLHKDFKPSERVDFIYTHDSLSEFESRSFDELYEVEDSLNNFFNILNLGGKYVILFSNKAEPCDFYMVETIAERIGFKKDRQHELQISEFNPFISIFKK